MLFYTLTPSPMGELFVRAHATKTDAHKQVCDNDGAKVIDEKEARRLVGDNEIDFLFAGQGVGVTQG